MILPFLFDTVIYEFPISVMLQTTDAQTYSFEQGSNASIECVPDGDTVLALFKNDNILFTQSASGPQTIGTSRFTADIENSSYRNAIYNNYIHVR